MSSVLLGTLVHVKCVYLDLTKSQPEPDCWPVQANGFQKFHGHIRIKTGYPRQFRFSSSKRSGYKTKPRQNVFAHFLLRIMRYKIPVLMMLRFFKIWYPGAST